MKPIMSACRMLLVMTILTGVIYPLVITGLAQTFFPNRAHGSLVLRDGKPIGSMLVGQGFSSNKYFWPRPSAIGYNPMPSGATNFGPTSAQLKKQVEDRRVELGGGSAVPVDLLFASGSGLDPHVSPAAAYFEVDRVARTRGFDSAARERLDSLVKAKIEPLDMGLFGEPRVNILELNLATDSIDANR